MTDVTSINRVFAQLSCSDIEPSRAWFTALFGCGPDAHPMAGLYEWRHGPSGGLQLFEIAEHAGHGTLTLIVSDIRAEHGRLEAAGLNPGPIERASTTDLLRLSDPDLNLVVLAQAHEK